MSATIQLHVVKKDYDKPSGSESCQILETFFRASQIKDYQLNFQQHTKPSGRKERRRLSKPYIVDGTRAIAVTRGKGNLKPHALIEHLVQGGTVPDLDARLTGSQKADSRAWFAYLHSFFLPVIFWTRFGYPGNEEALKEDFLGKEWSKLSWFKRVIWFPAFMNRIKKKLGRGMARCSREEVDGIIQEFVKNLSEKLDASGDFFHGPDPSMIDCTIYGFLVSALRMKSNPGFTKAILGNEILRAYLVYTTKLWFPEYKGILEMLFSVEVDVTASARSSEAIESEKVVLV